MDEALLKKRMIFTLVVTGVCAVVAMVSIYSALMFSMPWLNLVFWLALATGFGAQVLMIWRFWKSGRKP